MKNARTNVLVVLLSISALVACDIDDIDDIDDIAFRGVGRGNDWLANGLQNYDTSGIDPAFSLKSKNGLNGDGDGDCDDDCDDDHGWLAGDVSEHTVIRYLVECALPQGQSITKTANGELVVLEGLVGLAPEWKNHACEEECQQWVSACLMARRNSAGETVNLWAEGDHPAISFGDNPAFPHFEGVFFGNLFTPADDEYGCRGDQEGMDIAAQEGRDCLLTDGSCGLTLFEDCEQAGCEASGTGLYARDCRPDPEGPTYKAIAVHLGSIGGS